MLSLPRTKDITEVPFYRSDARVSVLQLLIMMEVHHQQSLRLLIYNEIPKYTWVFGP